jgi:hypothetical protein
LERPGVLSEHDNRRKTYSSDDPKSADKPATDPPAYREAATLEEIEESQNRDDKGSEVKLT